MCVDEGEREREGWMKEKKKSDGQSTKIKKGRAIPKKKRLSKHPSFVVFALVQEEGCHQTLLLLLGSGSLPFVSMTEKTSPPTGMLPQEQDSPFKDILHCIHQLPRLAPQERRVM